MYACGFRIYFTPLPGFFSPFPHGTGSLSVDDEYLALEDGPPIFRQDFTCPALLEALLRHYLYGAVTRYGRSFQIVLVTLKARLVRVRSPLLAESLLMSFPPGTEMFQFPGFASPPYVFRQGSLIRGGFPHSDIRGSSIARISPRLFAACHVLHRLLAPRHPPHALSSLLTLIPQQPASRRNWLKLETKVQAPALRRGPERIHLMCHFEESRAAIAAGLPSQSTLRTSQQKLISTLRMNLSKNILKTASGNVWKLEAPPAGCRRVAQFSQWRDWWA